MLTTKQLAWLDEELERYQHVDHLIAIRLLELDAPWRESDTNIGGGRSSMITRPQEQMIINHEADKQLNRLLRLRKAGSNVVAKMDEEQLQIYNFRYSSTNYYDWETIGKLTHSSRTQIYRKRYKLLELFAKEIGIC